MNFYRIGLEYISKTEPDILLSSSYKSSEDNMAFLQYCKQLDRISNVEKLSSVSILQVALTRHYLDLFEGDLIEQKKEVAERLERLKRLDFLFED